MDSSTASSVRRGPSNFSSLIEMGALEDEDFVQTPLEVVEAAVKEQRKLAGFTH